MPLGLIPPKNLYAYVIYLSTNIVVGWDWPKQWLKFTKILLSCNDIHQVSKFDWYDNSDTRQAGSSVPIMIFLCSDTIHSRVYQSNFGLSKSLSWSDKLCIENVKCVY